MSGHPESRRHAALQRDAAVRRLRRATQLSVALMVALGGAFAALAAASTHTKKAVVVASRSTHRAPVAAVLVQAPVPPLVALQSAPPSEASSAPAPAPAPAAPAVAPAPSYQQPVVVSGGS